VRTRRLKKSKITLDVCNKIRVTGERKCSNGAMVARETSNLEAVGYVFKSRNKKHKLMKVRSSSPTWSEFNFFLKFFYLYP
jgi:hypothetical protein